VWRNEFGGDLRGFESFGEYLYGIRWREWGWQKVLSFLILFLFCFFFLPFWILKTPPYRDSSCFYSTIGLDVVNFIILLHFINLLTSYSFDFHNVVIFIRRSLLLSCFNRGIYPYYSPNSYNTLLHNKVHRIIPSYLSLPSKLTPLHFQTWFLQTTILLPNFPSLIFTTNFADLLYTILSNQPLTRLKPDITHLDKF